MEHTPHNTCYELKIFVPQSHKDLFTELLPKLGIFHFVSDAVDCDLEAEYNPKDDKQQQYEDFLNNNASPMVIYHEDKSYLERVQKALEHVLPSVGISIQDIRFELLEIGNQWQESWKNSFKPVFVRNMFAILPPWEAPEQFDQQFKIIIDPGMAFGTGQHETTRLCLESMIDLDVQNKSVLDVGTGSGILAIAACFLKAKTIVATDLDPTCIPIAQENAEKNNAHGIAFAHKSCDQLEHDHSFDIVVANIQSTPLKTLLPEIKRLTTPQGTIVLSGILEIERQEFVAHAQTLGFTLKTSATLNDWCCLTMGVV